ncbi:TPA: hypothetical protein O3K68_000418 [Escherichia coli]|nr:hypothetical protein [Escherichia coli]HCZ5369056.1 hypothetical protein [Escherichia coli]
MNIETVNELITSLESAGEPSIREQKFLKLAKAFKQVTTERDAALNAERVWEKTMMDVCGEDGPASVAAVINALAAENVALKQFPEQIVQFIGGLGTSEIGIDTKEKIGLAASRIKTPATDRIAAEAEARGVEKAIAHLEKKFSNIGVQIMNLQWLADSLRKGASE